MYSEDDLSAAVQAGVLSEETARAFRSYVAQKQRAPDVDEEHFRLVTGFNDIFVVIACVLMLASVAWLGNALAPWVGALSVSAVAWGLAEFFVRKRRMALPAIVLLLAFTGGIVVAGVVTANQSSAQHRDRMRVRGRRHLAALAAVPGSDYRRRGRGRRCGFDARAPHRGRARGARIGKSPLAAGGHHRLRAGDAMGWRGHATPDGQVRRRVLAAPARRAVAGASRLRRAQCLRRNDRSSPGCGRCRRSTSPSPSYRCRSTVAR